MIEFNIVIASNEEVEMRFKNFINSNEICAVNIDIKREANGKSVLSINQLWEVNGREFLDLCREVIEWFDNNNYDYN